MRPYAWIAAVVMAGLVCSACKEKPVSPPMATTERAATEPSLPPAPPTTQELLQGPRQTLPLSSMPYNMPFTVRVPISWKLVSEGRVMLLQGPAPSGDVAIQLSHRSRATGDQIDLLVAGARKELADHPGSAKLAESRRLGDVRVLERQSIVKLPTVDEKGQPLPPLSPTFRWTINLFVPQGKDYAAYELNFVELSQEQYEQDKALLRQIVDSLQYEPTTAAGGL